MSAGHKVRHLKHRYPLDWACWSPDRRRAEVRLDKAIRRAYAKRDRAYDRLEASRKAIDATLHYELEKAKRAYAEGEE